MILSGSEESWQHLDLMEVWRRRNQGVVQTLSGPACDKPLFKKAWDGGRIFICFPSNLKRVDQGTVADPGGGVRKGGQPGLKGSGKNVRGKEKSILRGRRE